jgi:dUTP pyrophosphatase
MNFLNNKSDIKRIFKSVIDENDRFKHMNFAILKISVTDNELCTKYINHVLLHNEKILNQITPDSGFDLLFPETTNFTSIYSNFVDFKIKTEMFTYDLLNDRVYNAAFLIHPRSSISKTPLMLANHTGIIDAGYRGNIIGAFRNLLPNEEYVSQQYNRLIQICHPSMCPIYVVICSEESLSVTERGEGGFGSTG